MRVLFTLPDLELLSAFKILIQSSLKLKGNTAGLLFGFGFFFPAEGQLYLLIIEKYIVMCIENCSKRLWQNYLEQ